jgi:hypothetical protein
MTLHPAARMHPADASAPRRNPFARALRIALGASLVLLLAALAVALVAEWRGLLAAAAPAPSAPAAFKVGGQAFTVPAGAVRGYGADVGGRLDLVFHREGLRLATAEEVARPGPHLVFLTLGAAVDGSDPSTRAEDLYNRFVDGRAEDGPGGLILRRFRAGSPYEDEALYLAPPDGRAFTARCGSMLAKRLPPTCLWLVRIDGVDIAVRLDVAALAEWRGVVADFYRLYQAMRRIDGGATTP